MESKNQAFDKINGILEDTDYPIRITSFADIEDFLLDDANRRFQQYAAIGRVYDQLRGRPEIDRYPEPSVIKELEEQKTDEF